MNKTELMEWKSHPVTQEILSKIETAKADLLNQFIVMPTCDATAMRTARLRGEIDGANCILDAINYLTAADGEE